MHQMRIGDAVWHDKGERDPRAIISAGEAEIAGAVIPYKLAAYDVFQPERVGAVGDVEPHTRAAVRWICDQRAGGRLAPGHRAVATERIVGAARLITPGAAEGSQSLGLLGSPVSNEPCEEPLACQEEHPSVPLPDMVMVKVP